LSVVRCEILPERQKVGCGVALDELDSNALFCACGRRKLR
jgi:hypothetical protein